MMKGFAIGVVVTLLVLAAGAFVFVKLGLMPAGQDQKAGTLETWAATTSFRARFGREARSLRSPIPPTETTLDEGAKLYVSNCEVCHGAQDAKPSNLAKGLTPDPPQLAKQGVEDDPEGVTYAKIAHGIRFTGMPGFRDTLSETQLWQVALFLKHMDKLPANTRALWAKSKS